MKFEQKSFFFFLENRTLSAIVYSYIFGDIIEEKRIHNFERSQECRKTFVWRFYCRIESAEKKNIRA